MSVRRAPRLSLEELAPCLLSVPEPPRRLAWAEVFGTDRPVEVEIGSGKGLFLLTASAARPETNFLGIEIVRKYQLFAATRMVKHGRNNVRLACSDGMTFLRGCVAPGSVAAVHVYFPDPWWKKRHHKRRLFTPEFAALCPVVLAPNGRLHIATDVGEYFAVMQRLLAELPTLRALPPPPERPPSHDLDYLTNFERKARKQGKPIYRAEYERVGSDR